VSVQNVNPKTVAPAARKSLGDTPAECVTVMATLTLKPVRLARADALDLR
jgi:hypothetical protein